MKKILLLSTMLLLSLTITADDALMKNYHQWSSVSSEGLIAKAREFVMKGKQDSALVCYSIVANRYGDNISYDEKKVCAQAFNNAGYLYFFNYQDYAKSYAYLIQAMEISEALNLTDNLPYVYLNLGNMYLVYADMYHPVNPAQRSADLFRKGLRVASDIRDWDVYLTLFINLGNLEIAHGDVDSIRTELQEFDKLIIPKNIPKLRYAQLLRKAISNLQKKDYPHARALFFEQRKVNDSPYTPERFEYQALYNVVYTYTAEHRYIDAIRYTQSIDSLAKVNGMRDIEAEACEKLADLYKQTGDSPNVMKYRYLYLDKKDSIMTVGRMEEIGEIHFLHELQKVEEQVRDLKAKRKMQQMITWGIVLVALIIVVFLTVIIRKNKVLRERNLQLYHNTLDLLKQEETRRKELESQQANQVTDEPQEKYQTSGLSEEDKDAIATAVEKVLTLGQEIYSPTFSLDNLAELVGFHAKYVSQVINERYEKNFNTLIGDQRVKEACKRMLDKENYGNITLEGISQSVGFKSRNTFSIAFKRVTGLTPSEYQKLSKQ